MAAARICRLRASSSFLLPEAKLDPLLHRAPLFDRRFANIWNAASLRMALRVPSCNTRCMVETAAQLTGHVFPRLPVRQWVLSVPKRLRYFMQRDGAVLNMVLRIFLQVIAQSLQPHCFGAARLDKSAMHIGAVAFIHWFGSSLNEHVHLHVCVVDGVFEATAPGVIFHPVSGIDEAVVAQVQATLRRLAPQP